MMTGRSLALLMVLFAPLRTESRLEGELYSRRGLGLLDACGQEPQMNKCDCDDLNKYTRDTCDAAGDCVHTCIDDGDACTTQSPEVSSCAPQNIDVAAFCGAGNAYMSSTCDRTKGCTYACIDDGNACTTQSMEVSSCAPQNINVAAVCDDRNDKTIDTCSPDIGCMHTTCDDGNACTDDKWDDTKGQCVFQTKICDDGNESTLDICLPSGGGCRFLDFASVNVDSVESYYQSNIANLPENTYFYEDLTTLTVTKIESLLNWINKKVVLKKTPYCYKQTETRGAGEVLSTCPAPKQKLGALCYSPCQSGYSRQGTFDCQQECKPDWRDDGLFCRKVEYGRGAGYPWIFGDPLNDSGMFKRCEADHGSGNCEKHLAIVYPKCRSGYNPFGCCICRPPVPNCAAEGYNSPGFDLSCPVKIVLGDPTPLVCKAGLEQDGALCYPPCKTGFDGIGPVCWQYCDPTMTDCGIGCAKNTATCATVTVDMILAPLIVAANIATMGLTSAPANAARTVIVGAKTMAYTNKVGFALLKLASKLYPNKVSSFPKAATLVKRAANSVAKTLNVSTQAYSGYSFFSFLYSVDFSTWTSPEINAELDKALAPKDALFIKSLWAAVQFDEIQAAEDWNIAQSTLALASMVDITGITGVVAAYANPKCLDVVPFPAI